MTSTLTLDIDAAADLMKVHRQTVLDLIAAGKLPAARIGRAYVLIARDVLAHIEQQVAEQTAKRMGIFRPGSLAKGRRRKARPDLDRAEALAKLGRP